MRNWALSTFTHLVKTVMILGSLTISGSLNAQIAMQVHLNKKLFLPGDTIEVDALVPLWKARNQNGTLNIYLEMQEGPAWLLRYPLMKGEGGGSIILPEGIGNGLYTAYFALQNDFYELRGQVLEKAAKDKKVHMVLVAGKQELYGMDLALDKDNRFQSGPVLFADTARVFFSPPEKRKKGNNLVLELEVRLDSTFTALADTTIFFTVGTQPLPEPDTRFTKKPFSYETGATLANAEVVGTRKTALDLFAEKQVSVMFKTPDAIVFDGLTSNQFHTWPNIFEWLRGRVTGLQIFGGADLVTYNALWRSGNTMLFLDEMAVDSKTLALVQVMDIAMVKVFRPPYHAGAFTSEGGAIAVYTKIGNPQEYISRNQFRLQGYTPHTHTLNIPRKK